MEPRTLAQLERMTRERLHDLGTTRPRWSSEIIRRALSEAEREACLRANLLRDQFTEKLVRHAVEPGRSTVLLHPCIYAVEGVIRESDSEFVQPMDEETLRLMDPRWRTREGSVIEHYLVQALPSERIQLRLHPTPTVADTIVLDVRRLPRDEMEADDDEPEIAPRHHDHLVDWAVYRCASMRDADMYDPKRADEALAMFTANFGERDTANVQRKKRERGRDTIPARDY